VGHIPDGDAAVKNILNAAVDDSAVDVAHDCFYVSHGFECDETATEYCHVENDSMWDSGVVEENPAEL